MERAEGTAWQKKEIFGLDIGLIRKLAFSYAQKNVSYPIADHAGIKKLFEGFETTVVREKPITEYTTGKYVQIVALKLHDTSLT